MARLHLRPGASRSGPGVLAGVLAALLLSATLTACTSDPTPSAITLGWADGKHQAVRVTWKDSDAPNRISIIGVLSESPSYVKYLPATEPNTWAIPTTALPPDGSYRIAVAVGTSATGVSSKAGLSPVFDTDGPLRPVGAEARHSGGNVLVTWRVLPPSQDFTPDDPLDVPAGRQVYLPMIGRPGQPLRIAGSGTTGTRQVLANVRPPYLFHLRATNEWSSITGAGISARTSVTTAGIPTRASFGRPLTITGRTVQQEVTCAGTRCRARRTTTAGLPVVIQAQRSGGGPWAAAGRGQTTAGGHFQIPVATVGSRFYRAYAMVSSRSGALSTASSSAPALTRSFVQVSSAAWVDGNVKLRNEVVTATVGVRPLLNGTAIVQLWTGLAWKSVKEVPIVAGRTGVSFRAATPGAFGYRLVLPGTSHLGSPVFGVATPSLVVRIL
jgi:hypothetical protein